jgi:hypothetical protein
MPIFLTTLLASVSSIFQSRAALELENLALRRDSPSCYAFCDAQSWCSFHPSPTCGSRIANSRMIPRDSPFLITFCNAPSGGSFHPFHCRARPPAWTRRRPFPRRRIASPQAAAADLESFQETIPRFIRVGPYARRFDGDLGASNSPAPFRNCTEALEHWMRQLVKNAFLRTISGAFGLVAGVLGLYVPSLFFANEIDEAESVRQYVRSASSGGIVIAVLVALIFAVPCGFVAYRSLRFTFTAVRTNQRGLR